MKGAKGGNRDRIISWLFSEKTRKKREEELELEKIEEQKIDEKHKERRKSKKKQSTSQEEKINIEEIEVIEVTNELFQPTEEILLNEKEFENEKHNKKKEKKNIDLDEEYENDDDLELTLIDIFDIHNSEKKIKNKGDQKVKDDDVEIVEKSEVIEDIKDVKHKDKDKNNEEVVAIEVETFEGKNLEQTDFIKISIIEEIENILRNDAYDLKDIKYRIEVLEQQEKDEFLIENIEKIQKELDLLIKKFNQIKERYNDLYSYISIKDIDTITNLGIGDIIRDYIGNVKEGFDPSRSWDQIYEIEEFIDIIYSIIDIEKKKDDVSEKIETKLDDLGICNDEFIKLQDKYTNIELINAKVERYNIELTSALIDIEAKIANSVDVSKKIETTIKLVPDFNKIMEATVLMASTQLIPPTPLGHLFKASLMVSAAHIMASAITPQTEQKEIITTTVTDYSRDIEVGKDNINSVLNNIDTAFLEINYIKDTFEKDFKEYAHVIPEYDKLIQNLFTMEKELSRQKSIAHDYSLSFDAALKNNNQKVKKLEND